MDYGEAAVLTAISLSVFFFLMGCMIPDWDHPAVQKKFHFKWLGKFTHHRGHFHSLLAGLIYGVIIFIPCFFLDIEYFLVPPIAGFFGFLSHLVEDDLHRLYNKSRVKTTLKIW